MPGFRTIIGGPNTELEDKKYNNWVGENQNFDILHFMNYEKGGDWSANAWNPEMGGWNGVRFNPGLPGPARGVPIGTRRSTIGRQPWGLGGPARGIPIATRRSTIGRQPWGLGGGPQGNPVGAWNYDTSLGTEISTWHPSGYFNTGGPYNSMGTYHNMGPFVRGMSYHPIGSWTPTAPWHPGGFPFAGHNGHSPGLWKESASWTPGTTFDPTSIWKIFPPVVHDALRSAGPWNPTHVTSLSSHGGPWDPTASWNPGNGWSPSITPNNNMLSTATYRI